jgi:pyruvate formate lyase activating enzyme
MASSSKCHGVSLSFNEPTLLLEYALDLFPLVKRLGLNTSYISNGYMTVQALRILRDSGLDAVKFDVKGDAEAARRFCEADVNLVWRNVMEAKDLGMHVEVVVLLIPGVNDKEESIMEVVQSHLEYAGHDTPLHFTRFHPDYRMLNRGPTSLEKLERAYMIAKKQGVHYVYLGNCPGHRYENTYCHSCGELLIKRSGFKIIDCKLREDSVCPACSQRIPITGRPLVA